MRSSVCWRRKHKPRDSAGIGSLHWRAKLFWLRGGLPTPRSRRKKRLSLPPRLLLRPPLLLWKSYETSDFFSELFLRFSDSSGDLVIFSERSEGALMNFFVGGILGFL